MRLNWITTEAIASLQLEGSPSWQNQALRTLSMMLTKAVEHRYLHHKPKVKLRPEARREGIIDDAAEELLLKTAHQFRDARRLAGLPDSLKLYGARHAFATYAVEATGNVFAVADVMGHRDLNTTRIYQHPELGAIRDAIDERNRRIM